MAKKEIIGLVKNYNHALIDNQINVEKILLFGSHTTECAQKWSDIDVAVVSPDFGNDRFQERVLLATVACKIDPRIEPHPIGSEEFEKESWKTMIHEIKLNGIEIAA